MREGIGDHVGMRWDGKRYQERFGALAAAGVDVDGEADFVMGLSPASVLDAGCGTGRVAIELAGRGVDVVAVDADPSMISTGKRLALPNSPGCWPTCATCSSTGASKWW